MNTLNTGTRQSSLSNSRTSARWIATAMLGICVSLSDVACAPRMDKQEGLQEKDFTPRFVVKCRKGAEAGDAVWQAFYGRALLNGWGVETNHADAVELLRKSADAGNTMGQFYLGSCYEHGVGVEKDDAKATDLYRKAAEQGNTGAQYRLGLYYETVLGGENAAKAVELYRKAAEHGDAEVRAKAQSRLGACYYFGIGVEQNHAEAVRWYRSAAELGNASAQYGLGLCYAKGEGIARDMKLGINWIRKAAEQGDASAQECLGMCYYNGEGVEKDMGKSAEWYRKSAEQGNASSQYALGMYYANGIGVNKDDEKAYAWLFKAAEQGIAEAELQVWARLLASDKAEDREMGLAWLEKSATAGNVAAECVLGLWFADKDEAKSLEWYRKAANRGAAPGQYEVGASLMRTGDFDKQKEAVSWLEKAASQNHDKALAMLGKCYAEGIGVDKDLDKAADLYAKGAELGDVECMKWLGENEKSPEKAFNWNLKLAELGDMEAQFRVGEVYYSGEGVEVDYEKAADWIGKSAAQGHEYAKMLNKDMRLFADAACKVKNNKTNALKVIERMSRYPLLMVVDGTKTPEPDSIWHTTYGLKIMQVVNGAVLVMGTDYRSAGKLIYIRTSHPYVDGAKLEPGYYKYDGIYTYSNTGGGTSTVHAFSELSESAVRDMNEYQCALAEIQKVAPSIKKTRARIEERKYVKANQEKLKAYAIERLKSLELPPSTDLCVVQRSLRECVGVEIDDAKWREFCQKIVDLRESQSWLAILSEIAGTNLDYFPDEKRTDQILQNLWDIPVNIKVTGTKEYEGNCVIRGHIIARPHPIEDVESIAKGTYMTLNKPDKNWRTKSGYFSTGENKTFEIKPFGEKLIITTLTEYNFSRELFPREAEASARGDVINFEKRIIEWLNNH